MRKTLFSVVVGDMVLRWLSGVPQPMQLVVTAVTEERIICGPWEFDRETGAEIDDFLQWGPKRTGSRIRVQSKCHPKWPVKFTVEVASKQQAETLTCCLIRVERYLRRGIPLGDYKNPNRSLADRLAVARRKLQEDADLVASDAEVAEIVKRNRQLKSLDEAAANLKKGIAGPPITLSEYLRRKKRRKKP
jgi:hypothetical protein